jgi:hypothetical protein
MYDFNQRMFSVTLKATMWNKLAADPDNVGKWLLTCEMKQRILHDYKGYYTREVGFGKIEFETEQDMNWFLLQL